MFKKLGFGTLLLATGLFFFTGCDELEAFLSDADIAEGLKEALRVSTDTSVSQANVLDGYYGNAAIKIFLPPEVETASNIIKNYVPGGSTLLEELELKINRAAEDAAGEATPIFVDAITSITINDAVGILNGADSAATIYLKDKTFTSLKTSFQPKIENSLSKVGAQQAWNNVITKYNNVINTTVVQLAFPNAKPVNTDLADYTTTRGLNGLFYLVAVEEKEIRTNVNDRVTELLREVFAKQDD